MKTSQRYMFFVALSALMVYASDARAQGGGGGMMGMMRFAGQLNSELLAMEEVQNELKLSDEQKEKIVEAAEKINDTWRSERREIMTGGGSEDEVKELLQDLQGEEKELVDALDDAQKKRLAQLRYQRMGPELYRDKDALAALKISDEQKGKIEEAVTKSQEAMQEAMQNARESGSFTDVRETFTKMQNDLTTSIMEILTDEQKGKIEEMLGKKFEFPQRQRRQAPRNDF